MVNVYKLFSVEYHWFRPSIYSNTKKQKKKTKKENKNKNAFPSYSPKSRNAWARNVPRAIPMYSESCITKPIVSFLCCSAPSGAIIYKVEAQYPLDNPKAAKTTTATQSF